MQQEKIMAPHPGEIIDRDYLNPLGISRGACAFRLGVSPDKLRSVCKGLKDIDIDLAIRLSECFGTTVRFWLVLQMQYDLKIWGERKERRIRSEVDSVTKEGE